MKLLKTWFLDIDTEYLQSAKYYKIKLRRENYFYFFTKSSRWKLIFDEHVFGTGSFSISCICKHNEWIILFIYCFLHLTGRAAYQTVRRNQAQLSIESNTKKPTLHKKWSFPLWVSSVNVSKSADSCGFGHIYWRNP